ncbi:putative extracellular serine carboxypeptidase [Hypsizygus marmoreus]|uniref:Extracellular serine carboxypeptidase n=1 Tax=Hypsizygus marmoreus TaxID=39966 RepID=A0A369JH36_HYPMA|nr:putative extracellular serine carboxypeptidase [Hypsizygus marmoreus]
MAITSLRKLALLATPLALLSQLASAVLPDGRPHGNTMRPPGLPLVHLINPEAPVVSRNGTELPPYDTTYLFDQLIDHNNPSLGTFKQRYWHTYEYYEPGGPIILSTPGEGNADGYYTYLTNRTINGQIAQQQNASTIVLEHRFYGFSNPRPDLSVESLRLHTLQQAIDDLVYFANHVNLPMPNGDKLTPDKAPWVLVGGSYSGALTSWTMVNKPGVFFAGYASSGVVEAILNFWEYFEPIRLNMPKNCSADVQAVIGHIEKVFTGKNTTAIQAIKDSFGMGDMTHLDDVAGALRNNLWDWQSLQPTSGPGAQFYRFCDALEVKDGVSAPASGWGLEHALAAWSSYFKNTYFARICGSATAEDCLGSYDVTLPYWTDISINNAWRSWFWIVCNEVGYLQEGAPRGHPTLVTRLVQPEYDLRQCQQMFPAAFSRPPRVQIERTNRVYKGWDVRLNRLFFANGQRDPWKDATMSASRIHVKSTPQQPIALGGGFHCSDLGTASGNVDATVRAVQVQALASMKTWLATWRPNPKPHVSEVGEKSAPVFAKHAADIHAIKPINAFLKGAGII